MTRKKLFIYLFILSVVSYWVPFGFSIFDYPFLNTVDYGSTAEGFFAFGIAIAFLVGSLVGLFLLSNSESTETEKKRIKIALSLLLIISPITVFSIFILKNFLDYYYSSSYQQNLSFESYLLVPIIVMLVLMYSFMLYSYKTTWSKAAKIATNVFAVVIDIVAAGFILTISALAMRDGGLS